MKREIDEQEFAKFERDSRIFTIMFLAMIILPMPLLYFLRWVGVGIYLVIDAIGLYYAFQVEKYKKKYDIQTYKEIIAFTEGVTLTEIEKAREEGKRPYQKVMLAIGAALLGVASCAIIMWIISLIV